MAIEKSTGYTETERKLAKLCDTTFLKLWSYPNPYKKDTKELCDLIAVFENKIFLFFDRESRKFDNLEGDINVQWKRWHKNAIENQIRTAEGARRYILENSDKIYLDSSKTIPFPIPIPSENLIIYNIIIAHGAAEACLRFSPENLNGSLAITYSKNEKLNLNFPFLVELDSNKPVHVFDTVNLEIILKELDTVYDFSKYLSEKEKALKNYDCITYCGEEDLLANYFQNFDSENQKHFIGTKDKSVNIIAISEGAWNSFENSSTYKQRKEANKISVLWDNLLQYTTQNALDNTLKGNGNIFKGESAICEMAKEPRFFRRTLSELMTRAIEGFPGDGTTLMRNLSIMPSYYKDKVYVFLQLHDPRDKDYDNEYRPKRQALLEIACGVTKNKFPEYEKIIGIGIDAPKFTQTNSEDFILLNAKDWSEEDILYYSDQNKNINFLETKKMTREMLTIRDFPNNANMSNRRRIGRNEQCPCGSGKKYKRCCIIFKK
ncbi:SEC-C domain-containing protein [uncultured Chryseobacterium sp.]|uniref:YecA family protein n=1 Tax=uncultured Chryseobacterium sp. TaxID=259322 RepID=UPI0025F1C0B3|nr:SEC-C domain-containing protein [uncultured Chryseobacterium sp.]